MVAKEGWDFYAVFDVDVEVTGVVMEAETAACELGDVPVAGGGVYAEVEDYAIIIQ